MLRHGELVLPHSLRRDCNQQSAAFPHRREEFTPRLQFRDAIRAPTPTKKVHDQRAQREQVGGAHELSIRIRQRKGRRRVAGLQQRVFNAGREQFCDRPLADFQPLGLHQAARSRRDLVQLVLQRQGDSAAHPAHTAHARIAFNEPISLRCMPGLPALLNILRICPYCRRS